MIDWCEPRGVREVGKRGETRDNLSLKKSDNSIQSDVFSWGAKMHYRLYRYNLTKVVGEKEREIHPDQHFRLFSNSRGADAYGELVEYRGKRDSVLMFVREYRTDFVGLIGRHSTQREVTSYDATEDEAYQTEVDDDDYPNAAIICLPRLHMIACSDSSAVRADSAMSRLHQILLHRQKRTLSSIRSKRLLICGRLSADFG
jgi:hypothetical protein